MAQKIYVEKQQVRDPLILAILCLLFIYSIILLIQQLFYSTQLLILPLVLTGLMIILLGCGIYLMMELKLKLVLTPKSIKFKMAPLHSKKVEISWNDIVSCKVVETPRLAHMHSGNMRFWNEKKFTLTGRTGLMLSTKDGRDYFIGSRHTDELERSLKKALRKFRKNSID